MSTPSAAEQLFGLPVSESETLSSEDKARAIVANWVRTNIPEVLFTEDEIKTSPVRNDITYNVSLYGTLEGAKQEVHMFVNITTGQIDKHIVFRPPFKAA